MADATGTPHEAAGNESAPSAAPSDPTQTTSTNADPQTDETATNGETVEAAETTQKQPSPQAASDDSQPSQRDASDPNDSDEADRDIDDSGDDDANDDANDGGGRNDNGNQKSRGRGKGGRGGGRRDSRKGIAREPDGPTAVCRYGQMRYTGEFRHGKLKEPLKPGMKAVIRTDRGVELGEVVTPVCRNANHDCGPCEIRGQQLQEFLEAEGGDYPFRRNGRLLRIANQQDLIEHRHLVDSAKDAGKYCREQIRELKLPMRLVTVEHLLGGERIVFYFTAEQRVDFRELVRRLAGQYRTRVEMRQVGARDEARLVGDYERCGQRCCCQQFLKDLKPVSMRMAKVQKATLDPSKISGRCGRLMCCLRYEDQGYNELRKNLPHRNTWVRTEETVGRVIDTQIITQRVKLMQPDGNIAAVRVDEIIERNIEPQDSPEKAAAFQSRNRKEQVAEAAKKLNGVKVPDGEKAKPAEQNGDKSSGKDSGKSDQESGEKKGKRRGRRRRGRRRSKGKKGGGASDGGQQSSGGGKSKSRRRRKKGKGGQAGKSGGKSSGGGKASG